MHRIGRHERIKQDMHGICRLAHVGRKSVAGREIQPARRRKPFVPTRAFGIQRCHRADQHHASPRSGDRKGPGRIGTGFGAVKCHLIEPVKEIFVNQPVEILVNGRMAEPAFAMAQNAQL